MDNEAPKYYSFRMVIIALLAGITMGLLFAPRSQRLFSRHERGEMPESKIKSILELVEDEYVDPYAADSLATIALDAFLAKLDPHSRYISPEALQRELSDIRGNFDGIGATLRSEADTIRVAFALVQSPARAAGIRVGDRIITVDGDTVSGVSMKVEEVVNRIRGSHGTPVRLGILHYGASAIETIAVIRDVIPTNSVAYSGMIQPGIGYIHLSRFSETSYSEVLDAMNALSDQGMQKLILDLRNNGGGLLDAAVRIANEFLSRGDLIVYTQGAHQRRKDVKADGHGNFSSLPLMVMVDEFSASASEVVSGAIQDNDRGVIVGRRSFGKGLVQRQFDFSDGSAVWLTVARYYTPSGRCIQRPYDKGSDEYYSEYLKQVLAESAADSSLASLTDSTPYYTTQGRVVYGGGGIYPDKILPYHRDSLMVYYNQLANSMTIDKQAYAYVTANYDALIQRYPDAKTFAQGFSVNAQMLQSVIDAGQKADIAPNQASLQRYGSRIATLYKAYMAEYLFGFEAFYAIYTTIDTDLQASLRMF